MFKKDINFIGNRNIALIFSGILTIISIASLGVQGLHMGIDFTGGTLIEVGYQKTADLTVLRNTLDTEGFSDATVQNFGTAKDVLIRKPQEGLNVELSAKCLRPSTKHSRTCKCAPVEFGPRRRRS
jgi:preprotein translocase subunit SecF